MSRETEGLSPELSAYMLAHTGPEPEVATRLRAATASHPNGDMQSSPEQGALIAVLLGMLGARNALEIGTFTGYSALRTALALPEDGRLICCDISTEFTDLGKPFWQEAGIASKIDLRIGPATETLDHLIESCGPNSFDFAFIDADKVNYDSYYERALVLVRPGGLIAIDNVFWSGDVARPEVNDPDTAALKALNAKIHTDERVTRAVVPIGDGLTLAVVL